MRLRSLSYCLLLLVAFSAALIAQLPFVDPPADAPTTKCTVNPSSDPSTLRLIQGTAPLTYVFACGVREPGKCVAERSIPGSKDLPSESIVALDHALGNWSCVALVGITGWVPSDRLVPLPAKPAVPIAEWIGWYRNGPDIPHVKTDRLLITPGKTPGTLHVSGRGYWYGANDDVHFGEVNADATPFGRYLQVVDGSGPGACILDLVIDPTTHTLATDDNQDCGALNVRFWGKWTRFTPSTPHHK